MVFSNAFAAEGVEMGAPLSAKTFAGRGVIA